MRTKLFKTLPGFVVCLIALAISSCGSANEEQTLTAQADSVSAVFKQNVELNPTFLTSAYAEYENKEFRICINFEDDRIKLSAYTDAFIDYFLASGLKDNEADFKGIFNSLSRVNGKLVLQLGDVYGTTRTLEYTVQEIKYFLRTPRTKLNYNEVKAQALQLMSDYWVDVRKAHNADDVVFEAVGGFATYTILFNDDSSYRYINSGNLKDQMVKALSKEYARFGTFKPLVVDLFSSFGVEGYRYVYTNKQNDKTLKAVVPWNEIE
jgi:hypothetical protein